MARSPDALWQQRIFLDLSELLSGKVQEKVSSCSLFNVYDLTVHLETLQRFYNEIEVYIIQVGREQESKFQRQLPTPEEYIEMRLGSSACYTILAFVE
jgi:hypothetical protein